MKEQEKQLLLKDLCARLPYNTWVQYDGKDYLVAGYIHGRVPLLPSVFSSAVGPCPLIKEVKPLLRPLLSMTNDEFEEYKKDRNSFLASDEIDFFNKYHFDYRGLIEKGFALKAHEGMYETKTE